MCVKTELHVCQVLHVKIDVHVYQDKTTCLSSVTCQDRSMCVKTKLHVCQVSHVKIDVHVYQENTTCLLSVTCQDRCKCVSRHVCQVSHVRTDMSVKCKEGVQGTHDSDSTCRYSAIAKPNMTIKTKKLSII